MHKICCEPFFVFSREKIDLGSKVGQIPDKSGKNFTAPPPPPIKNIGARTPMQKYINYNTFDRMNFYSQRQLALKMTTLYRFQKLINKGNTQVNGSLLKFTYYNPHSCPRSCLCVRFMRFLLQQFCLQNANLKRSLMLYRDREKNRIISLANQNCFTRQSA